MSDIGILHDRLHKLVHGNSAITGKARDLMQPESASVLHAMLSEIKETHLLRRITFRNDRDEQISLEVASGRVLRISQPTSDHLQARLSDSLTQSISQSAKTQVSQFIEVLKIFASGATELSAEPQILHQITPNLDVGFSIDDLLQDPNILRQGEPKKTMGNTLETFLEDCAPISFAGLLLTGGSVVLEYGLEVHLKPLKALAATEYLSNDIHLQIQSNSNPLAQCVIYTGHPHDGRTVLCASLSAKLTFLSFGHDALDEVLTFWAFRTR